MNECYLIKRSTASPASVCCMHPARTLSFNSTFIWESSTSAEWLPASLNVAACGWNMVGRWFLSCTPQPCQLFLLWFSSRCRGLHLSPCSSQYFASSWCWSSELAAPTPLGKCIANTMVVVVRSGLPSIAVSHTSDSCCEAVLIEKFILEVFGRNGDSMKHRSNKKGWCSSKKVVES